jgi:GT2 family glycosyltransferase
MAPASTPDIDVIVPCYNYGRYLDECLRSLSAQTTPPAQVLVVDDGSTDEDAPLIPLIVERHGFRLIRQQNVGLVQTLRRGIAETFGESFVVVSADDRVAPSFLEKLALALRAAPAAGYAYARMEYFGDRSGSSTVRSFDAKTLVCAGNIVGAGALVRRSAYEDTRGFRQLKALEDWDLWLSFLEKGYVGAFVDEPLYEWRQHGVSRSARADMATRQGRRMRRAIQARHVRLMLRYYPSYAPIAARNFARRMRGADVEA